VTAALHYIRNHLNEPLKVGLLAEKLVVRRRVLEQKFRTLLGRSVLEEIHCARVERVKELLAESDLSMSELAERTGFSTPQRMATVFRKMTGLTPSACRRQSQVRTPP
jgi:LacI family transcriptional regulator